MGSSLERTVSDARRRSGALAECPAGGAESLPPAGHTVYWPIGHHPPHGAPGRHAAE